MWHAYSVTHRGTALADVPQPLHISGGRVVRRAPRHSPRLDLRDYVVLPAWVNAHDHLELNHYPRTRYRDIYPNAHEWGQDVNAQLDQPPFTTLRKLPLWERYFIGGLKNLLCGVTTVAQHGNFPRRLRRPDFPVRVLRRYGWSHSLHFDTPTQIVRAYHRTPRDAAWFIHLAEGTDAHAADEFGQLQALGCVGHNTVLIHAVGLRHPADLLALAQQPPRGLITCPTTNRYLLGVERASPAFALHGQKIAIGSDSRLTADGDLLAELPLAAQFLAATDAQLLAHITEDAAAILGLADVGHLRTGAHADWLALPHADLKRLTRADVQLVVRGGVPLIGAPPLMAQFPHIPTVHATLDDVPKLIHRRLAQRILACTHTEAGLIIHMGKV